MGKTTGMYQCPSCSQTVTYRSADTRIVVCTCGQVLNRLDSDDLILKPVLTIPEHNDLLKTGSTGSFEGRKFEVLGRFRVWLEESVYNYWTILFDDGSLAFLAEGYGMYAIMQRVTLDKAVTTWDIDHLAPTDYQYFLGEESWFPHRKDACWKYEVEGEVWMPECTDQFRLFDFYAHGDQHLEIVEFLPDYLVAYSIKYAEYNSLNLENLNQNPVQPKEVECTQCQQKMLVKTFPYAQSCSCSGCGARLVFKSSASGFRSSGKDKDNFDQISLPLGSTGTLKGIVYEVIGYALKQENAADGVQWKEYVLYNRAEGYAFLSEYQGTWIYARERGDSPVTAHQNPESLHYKGETFNLYNRYTIRILDTLGEFPYNIYDDSDIVSAEFISPPTMWIYEKSREEGISWFMGEHQDRDELLQQFPFDLPDKNEAGILDPKGHINLAGLIKVTLVAMAILTGVHFLIGFMQSEKQVFAGDLQLRDSAASTTFVSPKFMLNKWRSNLQFDLYTPLDNNWLDMEATLVNAGSGEEYSLEQLVQYYHGYEDGENWKEGSTNETAYLSSIPSGTYFLRIEAVRDTTNGGWNSVKDVSLTVKNDVPMHRNLLIFLGLLLLWPIGAYIWYRYKEKQRWEASPYSPFKNENE